jgi:GMP synthase (glutamine-hydrolysing)
MRKLLVFQHVPFEPLGLLDSMFRSAGLRIRYVNFHRDGESRVPVDRYHGLVVLGGPMSADATDDFAHLGFEQEAIRHGIDAQMPLLGICLGAQLMAASLGARVLRGTAPEFGWTRIVTTAAGARDPLLRHIEGSAPIFQWHSDTFELPVGAQLLASSPTCANQAIRIGENAYGLQFHLEADARLIHRWLALREDLPVGDARSRLDAAATQRETRRYLPAAGRLAKAVFGAFIERFFAPRRRLAHPSR